MMELDICGSLKFGAVCYSSAFTLSPPYPTGCSTILQDFADLATTSVFCTKMYFAELHLFASGTGATAC